MLLLMLNISYDVYFHEAAILTLLHRVCFQTTSVPRLTPSG